MAIPPMLPIEAVLFDMDGLLLDTERIGQRILWQALREFGYTPNPEQRAKTMGGSGGQFRALMCSFYGADYPFDQINRRCAKLWEEVYATQGIPVKKGAQELLKELEKQCVPCGVATSTEEKQALLRLELTGLLPYMRCVVCGDMVPASKPEPDVYIAAAKKLGIPPVRCLVLEDSPNGIMAGLRAGMRVIAVPDQMELPDEIRSQVMAVVESLSDVLSLRLFGRE